MTAAEARANEMIDEALELQNQGDFEHAEFLLDQAEALLDEAGV